MKKQTLEPEKLETLLAGIRAGGYPHVAAEAVGVSQEKFAQWLERGIRGGRGTKWHKAFVSQVRQAQAQARLKAEIDARTGDPKFWLRSGPGKETKDSPGWTTPMKPILIQDNRQVNLLASPEWNSLWATILQALGSFPEARAALAAALRDTPLLPPPKA